MVLLAQVSNEVGQRELEELACLQELVLVDQALRQNDLNFGDRP